MPINGLFELLNYDLYVKLVIFQIFQMVISLMNRNKLPTDQLSMLNKMADCLLVVLFSKTESQGVLAFQPILIEITKVNAFLRNLKTRLHIFIYKIVRLCNKTCREKEEQ